MSLELDLAQFRQDLLGDVQALIGKALSAVSSSRVVDVPVVLGTEGNVLVVGAHVFVRLGLNGPATILAWSLGATVGGTPSAHSVTVDVQVGSTLATVASICSTNKPALASVIELADQPPTLWTTAIADPQWLLVKATAVDGTIEVAGLTLRVMVEPR